MVAQHLCWLGPKNRMTKALMHVQTGLRLVFSYRNQITTPIDSGKQIYRVFYVKIKWLNPKPKYVTAHV